MKVPETLRGHPWADLPGGDLVYEGLEDLARGETESIPALLVQVGAPRLRNLDLDVPTIGTEIPEHRLYARLAHEEGDAAHSRYNALLRHLASFGRTAECVTRRR